MASSSVNISADMAIQPFSLTFVDMTGSASNAQVAITLVAVGPSSTVILSKLQYLSGGVYKDCTLINPPAGMIIPCSGTGETTLLTWDAYPDLGSSAFNNFITVVGAFVDGNYTTADANYSLYISKVVLNNKDKYRDEIIDKKTPGRPIRKVPI